MAEPARPDRAVPLSAPLPAPHGTPVGPSGGIVLSDLRKAYGAVQAVDGVSLRIAPGETVALLGPNGAGKSTTIDMLLGLRDPDSGSASIFGQSPAQAVARGAIGAMLQSGSLLGFLSVRELIGMMASLYPHPMNVDEVIELTGIGEIADRSTTKLSGGQSQRVRFALAIVADPDLLLLDEPTVAMDVAVRHEFWQTMRAFGARGKTVLFATHYLEEADAFADRVVLMARGRIVADGTANQIRAMVGTRTIRATVQASVTTLERLPGVQHVESHGAAAVLTCTDSDAALRALLVADPSARDIEVSSAGLEQAFLTLTADDATTAPVPVPVLNNTAGYASTALNGDQA